VNLLADKLSKIHDKMRNGSVWLSTLEAELLFILGLKGRLSLGRETRRGQNLLAFVAAGRSKAQVKGGFGGLLRQECRTRKGEVGVLKA